MEDNIIIIYILILNHSRYVMRLSHKCVVKQQTTIGFKTRTCVNLNQ